MSTSAQSAFAQAAIDRGDLLALRCVACHGPGGTSSAIPSITNLSEEQFIAKMRQYRSGAGKNVMVTRTSRLTDEDIEALARHFAARPRPLMDDGR
ncbi:c-type cytochrome [Chenggangzhangella methanolivorans]|uniref:Strain CHL1 chromosome, complete genome n=1 Tax=Chenggangzhangella methanolivorans TaxID=1437009 RepID=A0A9E6UR94_9HYPH|nr:c-type cytochrome [Chenggangzhangella methanolivorans]QZO02015.1 cytochrome c4 Flags: Precursor [Chenggangzhangella methanolivorans]